MKKDLKGEPVLFDWKARNGKVVFFETGNGAELFAIDGERLGLLLNPEYVGGQLRDATEEKTWPADWGIEKFVEARRLLQGDLNMAQIAALWNTTEASVRAFYGQASQKFLHAQDLVKQEEARQAKGDGTYVELATPWPADHKLGSEVQTHIMLNISRVAEMLKANGNNYREVWQQFDVKSDAFSRWLDANQKALAILGVVL